MTKGKVLAVVGAQYGSEAKGAIVGKIADHYQVHVRTGGPQAGHSVWYRNKKFVNRQIPVGWVNPGASLVIGRGALINPEVLRDEIKMLEDAGVTLEGRLLIDPKAGFLDPHFHIDEGGVNGEAHKRIGSTGEGVGPARVARVMRDPEKFQLFESKAEEWGFTKYLQTNTPLFLRKALDSGRNVLLEGAQGSGLSLIHGPWPYCTSTDTNAASMAADCGLPPQLVTNVMLVARVMPIRVAGNSGPLKNEITWEALSSKLGKQVSELTTVTKKLRRIGEWDEELIDSAVTLNAPTSFALTFADYLDPAMYGHSGPLSPVVERFVKYMESRWDVPVSLVGCGGQDVIIERSKDL